MPSCGKHFAMQWGGVLEREREREGGRVLGVGKEREREGCPRGWGREREREVLGMGKEREREYDGLLVPKGTS